jgi:hypothetical protein
MQRLLRRTALTVNRYSRHALRQFGRQHTVAPDMLALFSGLRDAAENHVLDRRGIEAGARQERVEAHRAEIDGMHAGQSPLATSSRHSNCIDNERF